MHTIVYSQDSIPCAAHYLFPERMTNYLLTECMSNSDSLEFTFPVDSFATTPYQQQHIKSLRRYDFDFESMEMKPECISILKFYEDTAITKGQSTIFNDKDQKVRIVRLLMASVNMVWVKIECMGDDNNDYYLITILE